MGRMSKNPLNAEFIGVQRKGKSRMRWLRDVKDDLKQMRMGGWREKAQEEPNCEGS